MEKFDMAQFLADAGVNLDTGNREQIEYISIDLIVPDPDNFYELSGLEDLAANISLLGLQQPIRVRPMPGDDSQFMIISGHRRHAALKLLIAQDGREDLRDVPCIVERSEENPKLKQLKLIFANASTRVLTSAEQAKQAEQVEKLLYELKEDGMEFPGRMRDHVAQACQMSTGKLARLKVIREGLTEFWKDAWKKGDISESVAYELARLSREWQATIFDGLHKSNRKDIKYVSASEIVTYANRFQGIDALTCKETGQPCENVCKKQKQSLNLETYYGNGPCVKCCEKCSSLISCRYSCSKLKDKIKVLRAKKQEQEKADNQRIAEAEAPDIAYIRSVYGRIGELRAATGISVQQFYEAAGRVYASGDDEKEVLLESGTADINRNCSMPFGYCFYVSTARGLCNVADLLGCSIDYLLGRTDTPTLAAAPAAEPEKCVNIDTWNTGTPPKPGWYICRIIVDGAERPMYLRYWYGGKTWQGLMEDIQVVTHWVPVVEEDE